MEYSLEQRARQLGMVREYSITREAARLGMVPRNDLAARMHAHAHPYPTIEDYFAAGGPIKYWEERGRGAATHLSPEEQERELGFIIEPYRPGMPLEGGFTLHGNQGTASIHLNLGDGYGMDIHHHSHGGGAVFFNPSDRSAASDEQDRRFGIILPYDPNTPIGGGTL